MHGSTYSIIHTIFTTIMIFLSCIKRRAISLLYSRAACLSSVGARTRVAVLLLRFAFSAKRIVGRWLFIVLGGLWSLVNVDAAGLQVHSEHSVLALLKLPIIWIMALCLVSGAASITFIESTLSLFLDKHVSKTETYRRSVYDDSTKSFHRKCRMWGFCGSALKRVQEP